MKKNVTNDFAMHSTQKNKVFFEVSFINPETRMYDYDIISWVTRYKIDNFYLKKVRQKIEKYYKEKSNIDIIRIRLHKKKKLL